MLASYFFKHVVTHGTLVIEDAHGKIHEFSGDKGPFAKIRLTDASLHWKLAYRPSLYFGKSYTDGTLIVEKGSLKDLLTILLVSEQRLEGGFLTELTRRFTNLIYRHEVINPIGRAQKNVEHHYDLSGELYDQFLDQDRQYSCAYYRSPDEDLETAQINKKQHIAAKLLLEPGQKVLEIGCGWGGMALYLARNFDVEVTGVTLSTRQFEVANERAKQEGLEDRVKFKLIDYREQTGSYDRIISIAMFEAVGLPHFYEYFDHVKRLLKDDGVALVHTIAKQGMPSPANIWVRRNIFPGGYLPTLSQLAPIFERQDLWLTDFENLRLHYSETLRQWNDRFQKNRGIVKDLYDERFCRMWEFYLQSSEMVFRHSGITIFQMQIAKNVNAVPLTRDYIYEKERELMEGKAKRRKKAGK